MELGVNRVGKKIKEVEKNDELQIKQKLDNPGMLNESVYLLLYPLCVLTNESI